MATTERKTRESKAEHAWIDANGSVVDSIESATGTRYTSKENGQSVDIQIPDGPGRLWLAAFGARTLATNEASAARQQGASAADQLSAIADRFALIAKGEQFVDRTREGGGFRINAEALCKALADVQVKTKKISRDARDAKVADLLSKVTEVDGVPTLAGKPLKFWHSAPGVRDFYDVHMGKEVASLDDLGAL